MSLDAPKKNKMMQAAPVQKELLAKGFVVGTARTNVIRLLPPYVTPKKAFTEFINALDEVLGAPASAGGELPAKAGAPLTKEKAA